METPSDWPTPLETNQLKPHSITSSRKQLTATTIHNGLQVSGLFGPFSSVWIKEKVDHWQKKKKKNVCVGAKVLVKKKNL